MKRLDEALNKGLEQKFEHIVSKLEKSLENGFEGCYCEHFISEALGEKLNDSGISYSTYRTDDFEESKVWYSKDKPLSWERKEDYK